MAKKIIHIPIVSFDTVSITVDTDNEFDESVGALGWLQHNYPNWRMVASQKLPEGYVIDDSGLRNLDSTYLE